MLLKLLEAASPNTDREQTLFVSAKSEVPGIVQRDMPAAYRENCPIYAER
jgi:hypothetical protein